MVEQGFIQKLDWAKIPNAQCMDAKFKGISSFSTSQYQLPKDWGTTGITLQHKFVEEGDQTWKQFFEVAPKYSGKIIVVNLMGDVFTAPLKALGFSLNSVVPAELNAARELLLGLAPHVLALNSDTYEVPINNKEAILGLTWTRAGWSSSVTNRKQPMSSTSFPRTARCTGSTRGRGAQMLAVRTPPPTSGTSVQ